MLNDNSGSTSNANENYFTASMYAQRILGSDANRHYAELRRLSRTHGLEELRREVDGWTSAAAPSKTPAPRGLGSAVPEYKRNLCAVAGGQRLCKDCIRKGITLEKIQAARAEQEADLATKVAAIKAAAQTTGSPQLEIAAGVMAQAQGMFLQHRQFVRKRIHAELTKYHHGHGQYRLFDDLEAEVWSNVAARITGYRDQGLKRGSMAWLKSVVFSTVSDHFEAAFAQCRDVRQTDELEDPDGVSIDPQDAKPTNRVGAAPDEYEVDGAASWQDACSRHD